MSDTWAEYGILDAIGKGDVRYVTFELLFALFFHGVESLLCYLVGWLAGWLAWPG
jgi:hypothetical protein